MNLDNAYDMPAAGSPADGSGEPGAAVAVKPGAGMDHTAFLNDLQGNVLRVHARPHAQHIMFSFRPGRSWDVRIWIAGLAARGITTAWREESNGRTGPFRSILLSASGYQRLGLAAVMPDDPAFRAGMKERGSLLADPSVAGWHAGYRRRLDALLIAADDDAVALSRDVARLKEEAWAHGLIVEAEERGGRLTRDGHIIEHFGYIDGITRPSWAPYTHGDGLSPRMLARPGALLREESGAAGHFGSFLVFRKLEQNVQEWERNVVALASALEVDPELAGALAVGRFRDGTPVVEYEQMQGVAPPRDDFSYEGDPSGSRCPFHAHVRRTNPRSESRDPDKRPGSAASPDVIPQDMPSIARCGMTYGIRPDLHPGGSGFARPRQGVGLLFMCFQNTIERQFERIQRAANGLADPGSPHMPGCDPVIGQGACAALSWPVQWGGSERREFQFSQVVTLRGGEYFFAPSITFLKNMRRQG